MLIKITAVPGHPGSPISV